MTGSTAPVTTRPRTNYWWLTRILTWIVISDIYLGIPFQRSSLCEKAYSLYFIHICMMGVHIYSLAMFVYYRVKMEKQLALVPGNMCVMARCKKSRISKEIAGIQLERLLLWNLGMSSTWLYSRWIYCITVLISDKTSYRKISWSLEAERLIIWIINSLWNLRVSVRSVNSNKSYDVLYIGYLNDPYYVRRYISISIALYCGQNLQYTIDYLFIAHMANCKYISVDQHIILFHFVRCHHVSNTVLCFMSRYNDTYPYLFNIDLIAISYE